MFLSNARGVLSRQERAVNEDFSMIKACILSTEL